MILVERFCFEMKKRYDQTELQLLLSPTVLIVTDNLNRPEKDKHLGQGRLTLSALQVFLILHFDLIYVYCLYICQIS